MKSCNRASSSTSHACSRRSSSSRWRVLGCSPSWSGCPSSHWVSGTKARSRPKHDRRGKRPNMTLILNNDEIAKLLPMADCLKQMDEAYRELGEDRAASRPRSDIYGPTNENGRYVFKTMDGMVPKFHVPPVPLNSDLIHRTHEPPRLHT